MQKLTTVTNYTIIFQVCLPVYHSTTATGLHAHYCAESQTYEIYNPKFHVTFFYNFRQFAAP